MRIAIQGSGGVGGWMGAKLIQHGADEVFFILRDSSDNVAALKGGGLSYRAVEGDYSYADQSSTSSPQHSLNSGEISERLCCGYRG